MKKLFYLLLISLCMGMTSCSSDDDGEQGPNKVQVVITLTEIVVLAALLTSQLQRLVAFVMVQEHVISVQAMVG